MQICGGITEASPRKFTQKEHFTHSKEEEDRYFGRSWLQHANLIQIRSAFCMTNFAKVKTLGGGRGAGEKGEGERLEEAGCGWATGAAPPLGSPSLSLGYRGTGPS